MYVISSIISFGIMIICLPIYTRLLNPEEYGIALAFIIFGKIVCGFFHFSLHDATYRFYFEYKDKLEAFKQLNSSNLLFLVSSFFVCYLIIYFSAGLFSDKIFDGQLNQNLINLSLISGFLDYLFLYLMTILTAQ